MKQTLLEMTQRILESMKSDEVNSINDTPESSTVARIVQDSYYDLQSTLNLPEHFLLFELDTTTTSTPVQMGIPSGIFDIAWIKYNVRDTGDTTDNLQTVASLSLEEFLSRQNGLDENDTEVSSMTLTSGTYDHTIKFYNERFPTHFTVFDDNTILFNGIKLTVDNPLQSTKTQCYGQTSPVLLMEDAATPDLDARQFNLLYNKAKSQAFIELKQTSNPVAERRERTHMIKSQRYKSNFHGQMSDYHDNTVDMGRRR